MTTLLFLLLLPHQRQSTKRHNAQGSLNVSYTIVFLPNLKYYKTKNHNSASPPQGFLTLYCLRIESSLRHRCPPLYLLSHKCTAALLCRPALRSCSSRTSSFCNINVSRSFCLCTGKELPAHFQETPYSESSFGCDLKHINTLFLSTF